MKKIDSFYIGEVNINNDLNGRGIILMNKLVCKQFYRNRKINR